jgi:hypothetical protein
MLVLKQLFTIFKAGCSIVSSVSDDLRSIVLPDGDFTLPSLPLPFLELNPGEKDDVSLFKFMWGVQ